MRLTIQHRTVYRYEPPALNLHLRLKLFASTTVAQTPVSWQLAVNGKEIAPLLKTGFGDGEALVALRHGVAEVEIAAEGEVITVDTAGVLGRVGIVRPDVFLRRTPLTEEVAEIREIGQQAWAASSEALGRMHALSALVGQALDYRKGATEAGTSAAQALTIGGGVCQDFTHVFIAASRSMGVPARYIVGYLHDPQEPVAETHAWAEAHVEGLGWVGFDTLHQLCTTESYVRLTSGFDAADAAPIRGTLAAGSTEELDVKVTVRAEAEAQQQQ